MLLTSRKLIQRKLMDVECDMRGTLRNFGLKIGTVSPAGYEARIRELVYVHSHHSASASSSQGPRMNVATSIAPSSAHRCAAARSRVDSLVRMPRR